MIDELCGELSYSNVNEQLAKLVNTIVQIKVTSIPSRWIQTQK